jgi:hypothetical protein
MSVELLENLTIEELQNLKIKEEENINSQYWRFTRTKSSRVNPPNHSRLIEINKMLKLKYLDKGGNDYE